MGSIVFCIPGPREHQETYVAAIERFGLAPHAEYCLQVSSWNTGRDQFPDRLGPEEVKAASNADKSVLRHGWSPRPPTHMFYNYEPRVHDEDGDAVRDWQWERQEAGFDEHDHKLAAVIVDELTAWRKENGSVAKIGFYGQPFPTRSSSWTIHDIPYLAGVQRFLQPFEWVGLNLYPKWDSIARPIPNADVQRHRRKVIVNYNMLRALFPKKPIIPMIWTRFGMDNDRYFSVYLNAIAETDAETVMIWANPHTPQMTEIYIGELERAAPHLLGWAKGGPVPISPLSQATTSQEKTP